MTKSKLTKYAFNIADIISWLFVILSVLLLILIFVPPPMSTWSVSSLSPAHVSMLEAINTLLGGIGYYLIIKRKIYGFVLIMLSIVIHFTAIKSFHIHTIYYTIGLFVILGLPWVLSYKEVINENKT